MLSLIIVGTNRIWSQASWCLEVKSQNPTTVKTGTRRKLPTRIGVEANRANVHERRWARPMAVQPDQEEPSILSLKRKRAPTRRHKWKKG